MQNGWNKQEGVTVVDPGAKKKKKLQKNSFNFRWVIEHRTVCEWVCDTIIQYTLMCINPIEPNQSSQEHEGSAPMV